MARQERDPLLNKVYYETCSGCRVLQQKEDDRTIPFKKLLFIWIIVLASALPISSLFPFLYFMIRDFDFVEREEDISYYAGYVGAAQMFGRVFTSILWGVVADRYGRKPVIIISTINVVVFTTLFGLSVNYWMAISTRFLLGALNGVFGTIKAYATDLCREEHQALALSTVATSWSIGLAIGPVIGGFLAQPADKYPNIFHKESLFGRFPYFLPCLCISLFALGVSISTFWLQETIHKHPEASPVQENSYKAMESATCPKQSPKEYGRTTLSTSSKPIRSLLTNWKLMSTFPVYCIFSFHDMAYSEIFSLWAVSPRSFGGLGYSTEHVGQILSITGVGMLVSQFVAFPFVERIIGPVMTMRISSAISIPLLQSYPFMALLSGGLTLQLLISCASVLKNVFSMAIVTSLFILQNNAVEQDQRGAANGLAMTVMSFSKTIGPACGGAVLSWTEKRQGSTFLPGCQMVFIFLNVTQLLALILTFKPFLVGHGESTRTERVAPDLEDMDLPQHS